ncbi:hypothetical protein NCU16349 [Neurospora crassa OR74A]|uniref:Uncharacterized protein n=1 Tax=Neurospora crassa (strain ATCC 24698 / 74-OR23-1A / CBS 708.71 / DSM 1257 / FGSC 987) TaxID=367110 RepID=V5IP04_NEUCR|nr:hypothetical protein NCU16349 [Neurospora crassa OR74A]ESA43873.1 hypothetical protein NCU16349 [Neurospora crassa OR74A]|eukprot:XP_011393352.1 hypothetical protein NCU16349 [Neurospora crassa OR74A]
MTSVYPVNSVAYTTILTIVASTKIFRAVVDVKFKPTFATKHNKTATPGKSPNPSKPRNHTHHKNRSMRLHSPLAPLTFLLTLSLLPSCALSCSIIRYMSIIRTRPDGTTHNDWYWPVDILGFLIIIMLTTTLANSNLRAHLGGDQLSGRKPARHRVGEEEELPWKGLK